MSALTLFDDGEPVAGQIDMLVVAGWTGRDTEAVAHHVHELEVLGVSPPSSVPLFYRASASLLTTGETLQVVGDGTSGEVEPMIVQRGNQRWLGLASDHTDRALEAHSVALSKQACGKPCASTLWPLAPLTDRLDRLILRSWLREHEDDRWTLYQDGTLATLLPLPALLAASPLSATDPTTTAVMLCGTLPAIGGVRGGHALRMELADPDTGSSLRHEYAVQVLPQVS